MNNATKTELAAARAAFADHVYACSEAISDDHAQLEREAWERIAGELRTDGFYREAREIEREHLNEVE